MLISVLDGNECCDTSKQRSQLHTVHRVLEAPAGQSLLENRRHTVVALSPTCLPGLGSCRLFTFSQENFHFHHSLHAQAFGRQESGSPRVVLCAA